MFNSPLIYPFTSTSTWFRPTSFPKNILSLDFKSTSILDFANKLYISKNDEITSRYGAAYFTNKFPTKNGIPVSDSLGPTNEFTVYPISFTNTSALHGIPVFQNLISNLIIKNFDAFSSIETSIHPLPFTSQEYTSFAQLRGLPAALIITISYCFVTFTYVTFIVKENEIKVEF